MAVNAYLMIKGQKQGAINGPVTVKQHENSILIHAFDNQVTSPRDPTTGQASGERQAAASAGYDPERCRQDFTATVDCAGDQRNADVVGSGLLDDHGGRRGDA